MNRTGKALAFIMAGTMIAASLAGCGSKDKNTTSSTAKTAVEDKIDKITWLTTGDTAAKPILPTDRVVAEINKKLSIDLKVNVVPEGDVAKVNVAMASGDLPDVVTGAFATSATNQWIKDGLLIPLNDYFDQTPNLKSKLTGDLSWTANNGKYYGMPFITQYKSSNLTLSFRQDWLDKLGLKAPKTLDDFYNVLKAFKEKDPDGNGKADTYGLTSMKPTDTFGLFDFVFYAYGREYADFSLDASGKAIPHHEHSSFKPGMQYLAKLYKEGLIDPEFLLNDRTKMEEKFYQGKAGYLTAPLFRHVSRIEGNLQKVTPTAKLGYSYTPEGPNGKKGYAPVGKTGMFTGVTNKSKAPAKAAKFIDFMISKTGEDLLRLGIEGVHYTKDGTTIKYNEEERAKDNFAANGWGHPLAWGSFAWPLESSYLPSTEPSRERALESVKIASELQMKNLVTSKPAAQVESGKVVDDLFNQYFIDMLQGKMDIDKGVDELSKKWRSQGGDKILAEVQQTYSSAKK